MCFFRTKYHDNVMLKEILQRGSNILYLLINRSFFYRSDQWPNLIQFKFMFEQSLKKSIYIKMQAYSTHNSIFSGGLIILKGYICNYFRQKHYIV